MYVWNGFAIVGKRADLTENLLVTIEKEETALKNETSEQLIKMMLICWYETLTFLFASILLAFCEVSSVLRNMHLNLSIEILELLECLIVVRDMSFIKFD